MSNSRTTRFGGRLSAAPAVTRLPRLLDLTRVDIRASPLPLTFHLYRPSLISRRSQRPALLASDSVEIMTISIRTCKYQINK